MASGHAEVLDGPLAWTGGADLLPRSAWSMMLLTNTACLLLWAVKEQPCALCPVAPEAREEKSHRAIPAPSFRHCPSLPSDPCSLPPSSSTPAATAITSLALFVFPQFPLAFWCASCSQLCSI